MLKNIDLDITELNDTQKEAVIRPINTFTKIAAGAGTGKTKIISKRFVKLVLDLKNEGIENPVEKLLVITFTQKAATHMKEKIFGELNRKNVDYWGQEDWISTIHGFCSKILKKHALEVGLSPSYQLCDEKTAREIYNNVIKRIVNYEIITIPYIGEIFEQLGIDKNIFDKENLLKLNLIDNLDDIFSGIFEIIKKIKSQGLTPKEFLTKSMSASCAFSSVAGNLKLGYATKEEYQDSWCESLSKYADAVCRFDDDVFGDLFETGLIIDKNSARGKNAAQSWSAASGFPENIPHIDALEQYLTKIIAVIYSIFQRELEIKDLIDFDDLINKTLFLFDSNEVVRKCYKKHFKHIIVDEFQDTSTAQMKLILALMSDEFPNLTIVGDRKQSIYGFRYARMENIDVIQKIIEEKYSQKFAEIKLETNYRSTPYILDAVNFVTEEELLLDEGLKPNPDKNFERNGIDFKITKICDYDNSYDLRELESKYIASEIIGVKEKQKLQFKDFAVLVKNHAHADVVDKILSSYGIPCVKKVSFSYFEKEVVKNIIALLEFADDVRNEIAFVKIMEIYFSQKDIYKLKKALDKFFVSNFEKSEYDFLNFSQKVLYMFEKNKIDETEINAELKVFLKELLGVVFEIAQNKKLMTLYSIYLSLKNKIHPENGLWGEAKYLAQTDMAIFEKIITDYMKTQNYVSIKNFLDYIDIIKEDKSFELPQAASDEIDAVQILTIYASKGLEFPYVFVTAIKNSKEASSDEPFDFELNESQTGGFGIIAKKFKGKISPKYGVYRAIYTKPRLKSEDLRIFYVALSRAEKCLNLLTFEKKSGSVPADYVTECVENFKDYLSEVNPKELEVSSLSGKIARIRTPIRRTAIKDIPCKRNNISMSFSKINVFNHCQKKFLYKYIYEYPAINENVDFSVTGSVVHNFIYNFYVTKKLLSEDAMKRQLENINVEDNERQRILAVMKQFSRSRFADLTNKKVFSEYSFDFSYEEMNFQGDVDLIVENEDGTVDIIDFKTNKNLENSLNDYFKQMFIYKKALEHQDFKVKNLIIVNLKQDMLNEVILTENDLLNAQKAIDNDIQNIKNVLNESQKAQANTNSCKNCEFGYLCKV